MGLSVRFTPRSLAQLGVLRDRIARDRPMAAELVRGRVLEAIKLLQTLPRLGSPGRRDGTRELVVAGLPCVVVYRVDIGDADEVVILRLVYGGQNW
jgi:Plasmid stabilization system protein